MNDFKVYFLCDIYRGDQNKNIDILHTLLLPIFEYYGLKTIVVSSQNYFTDEDWILSLKGLKESYLNNYNITNEDFVIGFEINKIDLEYLNKNNIRWINFEIHPVRFLDDLYFSITSSFEFDWQSLGLEENEIQFYADVLKLRSLVPFLEENALLIIGQTPMDKSVFYDNEFKSLASYYSVLDNIATQYNKVYYRHHPNLTNPELDHEIIQRYNATLINNENFYAVISSDNIKCITGISSSTLYESKFFNKNVEFLEQRIKDFGRPISLQSLYSSSNLWLSLLLNKKFDMSNLNINFENNLLRKLFGTWSYKTLEQEVDSLNNRYMNLDEKMNESFDNILNKLNERVFQAEQNLNEANERAFQAEQNLNEANERAVQAEQNANEANERAVQAEQNANEANERAVQAEQNANEANERAVQAEQNANEANERASQLMNQFNMIEGSNSWKITKPFRLVGKFVRWFIFGMYHWLTFSPTSRPRRVLKSKLINLKYYINERPKLKYKLMNILNNFPTLKSRLKKIGKIEISLPIEQKVEVQNVEFSNLSPRAKQIYLKLKEKQLGACNENSN